MYRKTILLIIVVLFAMSISVDAYNGLAISPLDGLTQMRNFQAKRESSSDPNLQHGNGDARSIQPGETLVLADIEGPGQIAHIWFTIMQNEFMYGKKLILRMYWDGSEHPSVECPINDFFCQGHGMDVEVDSFPLRVTSNGRARNCYWPMPFKKSAKITVTNYGETPTGAFYYYIDWQKHEILPEDTLYFHAQYRQEFPNSEDDYLILDAEGKGHFVGCNLSVRQRRAGWWGEGDDRFYIDGEEVPSLKGTGSEDYFCDAWGIRKMDGLFYGCTISEGFNELNKHTCYRFHIQDPVPFTKSLKMTIEHKGSFTRDDGTVTGYDVRYDDYSSVAYWYQTLPHKPFPPLPSVEEMLYDKKIVEAENLVDTIKYNVGEYRIQEMPGLSCGKQILYISREKPAGFSVTFDVEKEGEYIINGYFVNSFDYGIYDIYINDVHVLNKDFYNQYVSQSQSVNFGRRKLNKGANTIRFVSNNKNSASTGYFLGFDSLQMFEMPEFLER